MYPVILAITMPPTAPAVPPMPTTDPTAWRGNMSDVSVNTLADHPWCAAAARLISATAPHMLRTPEAVTIGTTATAQTSMAVFRAAFTLQPRWISDDESQPPPTLPMSATR